jgi:hypothetical protein
MLNDPKPHYAHQSNLAEEGTIYPILNAVVGRYKQYFKAPLVQYSQKQAGQELQRKSLWLSALNANQVSGYLLDGQIHVQNRSNAAVEVPVTGVPSIGDVYGGIRSGWTTVAPNSELVRSAPDSGQPIKRAGSAPAPPAKKGGTPKKSAVRKLRLSKVKISPSKFSRRSSARITWKSNRAARLRLAIEKSAKGKRVRATCQKPTKRLRNKKNCTRYLPQARINKKVAAGNGRLKLTTKVGKRTLRPGTYRLRAVLTDGKGNHSPVRNVKFVVKR